MTKSDHMVTNCNGLETVYSVTSRVTELAYNYLQMSSSYTVSAV